MSAPITHYRFHVELKPFHRELTRFPVLFVFYEVHYLLDITEGHRHREFRRAREPLIIRKLAQISVGDSLFDHIQDFKDMLTRMDIPEIEQSKILVEIAAKALDIDTYSRTFMSVKIVKSELEEDIARAERESMGIEARSVPAAKSSIDALERVDFDGSTSARDCTVCMEEIEAGSEAIRMPCSHVYHPDCIVQWLQTSHLCPLCRYQMPCEL